MIISSIAAVVAKTIGTQVIDYLKTHQEEVQFEKMQGEILEGWVYKIRIAIRDEHRRQGVDIETHRAVMTKVEEVVRDEFDSTKL